MSAIDVSSIPKFDSRMEHIDIRHQFIRDCVEAETSVVR